MILWYSEYLRPHSISGMDEEVHDGNSMECNTEPTEEQLRFYLFISWWLEGVVQIVLGMCQKMFGEKSTTNKDPICGEEREKSISC